ncbi:MAG: hypothetical protein U0670_05715 [Anaerolineae bacterium]
MTPPFSTAEERRRLTRALLIGVGLSMVGIILFIVIYMALSQAQSAPRLFVSLCVPPAIIALILGVYILVARPKSS